MDYFVIKIQAFQTYSLPTDQSRVHPFVESVCKLAKLSVVIIFVTKIASKNPSSLHFWSTSSRLCRSVLYIVSTFRHETLQPGGRELIFYSWSSCVNKLQKEALFNEADCHPTVQKTLILSAELHLKCSAMKDQKKKVSWRVSWSNSCPTSIHRWESNSSTPWSSSL